MIEQADGTGKFKKLLKKLKVRFERRKAKKEPDCQPTYKGYRGYQT